MPKRLGPILFVGFAALFLTVNHAAYRGYFQDDEIDNIAWTPHVPLSTYLLSTVSPRFEPNNFRPVGHFYFYLCEHFFHLNFPPWVAALHAIHLLNVCLLWLLLRRLGAPPLAAGAVKKSGDIAGQRHQLLPLRRSAEVSPHFFTVAAGAACLFFGLHMALFDAVWKPMYAFDVLCATFCLLAIYLYLERRWLVAFAAFWLAYKAKEVAVMLPLVLAALELCFGKGDWKRRWLPLAPFFLASLSFGLQGILLNPNQNNEYTFRFTPAALVQTSTFYASRVFLVPYLGFALPLIAAFYWRNRRVWFGLATMAAFFVPMLFLPGRLFSAYCYVPFLGLAFVFSALAEASRPASLFVFFLIWGIQDIRELRLDRRATLALDDRVHQWVGTLGRFAHTSARPDAVIYDGVPAGFHFWGIEGAVHYLYQDNNIPVVNIDDSRVASLQDAPRVAVLNWNNATARLNIHLRGADAFVPYLTMDGSEPPEQLREGWYGLEGDFRWTAAHAVVELSRPASARQLELRVLAAEQQIRTVGPITVRVSLDGVALPPHTFSEPGWSKVVWDVPPGPAGPVHAAIDTTPAFQPSGDRRTLGAAVGAIGFISR